MSLLCSAMIVPFLHDLHKFSIVNIVRFMLNTMQKTNNICHFHAYILLEDLEFHSSGNFFAAGS